MALGCPWSDDPKLDDPVPPTTRKSVQFAAAFAGIAPLVKDCISDPLPLLPYPLLNNKNMVPSTGPNPTHLQYPPFHLVSCRVLLLPVGQDNRSG